MSLFFGGCVFNKGLEDLIFSLIVFSKKVLS